MSGQWQEAKESSEYLWRGELIFRNEMPETLIHQAEAKAEEESSMGLNPMPTSVTNFWTQIWGRARRLSLLCGWLGATGWLGALVHLKMETILPPRMLWQENEITCISCRLKNELELTKQLYRKQGLKHRLWVLVLAAPLSLTSVSMPVKCLETALASQRQCLPPRAVMRTINEGNPSGRLRSAPGPGIAQEILVTFFSNTCTFFSLLKRRAVRIFNSQDFLPSSYFSPNSREAAALLVKFTWPAL